MSEAVPTKESITVEFKSDRKRLPDDDLIDTVVGMANASGGSIFLGVEDDGTPTGLHQAHNPPDGLPALVANRTVPSVRVSVELITVRGQNVARVIVPQAPHVVATTTGGYYRRRIKHDGTPENAALLPHDIPSRLGQLGIQDTTRQPVPGASRDDLDPAERTRLRQFIERNNGDPALAGLADDELRWRRYVAGPGMQSGET